MFLENPKVKTDFLGTFGENVAVYLRREDQIHPEVSGNKFRKLKYNLIEAKAKSAKQIITFGGAFSNHIAATAAACQLEKIPCLGIIRGEELAENLQQTLQQNSTLAFAYQSGMQFKFITRSEYKKRNDSAFLENLQQSFPDSYIIPEGGSNELGVQGCEEIITETDRSYDIIACAVGSGGTIAGIVNAVEKDQEVWGFPALKGNFLTKEISKFAKNENFKLVEAYHFGGYAKVSEELIQFINNFKAGFLIALDPVYTGKLMFGIFDLIKIGELKNKKVLAIHTGGLQGIAGMNKKLKNKGLPLIQ